MARYLQQEGMRYMQGHVAPAGPPGGAPPSQGPTAPPLEREKVIQYVLDITNEDTREYAMLVLSKKRDSLPDLAPLIWYSYGTVAALLQEIVAIYPLLFPPNLSANASNRASNALALLQCVASHAETRPLFLQAHIPLFLYPLLNTNSKSRPFEYLRLTSLGVIGALVKQSDEPTVIDFLLQTEIIPLCLRIMETGNDLNKTVSTFIVQKILIDDGGLQYICQTYERFSHVALILGKMVHGLAKIPSARLLKHVVRCYLRLADNARARDALKQVLPEPLRDNTFAGLLKEDPSTKRWLQSLLAALSEGAPNALPAPWARMPLVASSRALASPALATPSSAEPLRSVLRACLCSCASSAVKSVA